MQYDSSPTVFITVFNYRIRLKQVMPRQPKLRKKKVGKTTYWYTEAGCRTYFGNVVDVPFFEARKLFSEHVKSLAEGSKSRNILSVAELVEKFLEWIEKKRSPRTYDSRRRQLNRFGNFKVRGKIIADFPAEQVRASDLEKFLDAQQFKSPQTRLHYETGIKHCWSWARKHRLVSLAFQPFASVERTHVPRKALTEDDLLIDSEIDALLEVAKVDLDQFHRLMGEAVERRDSNPYQDFSDMLKCYLHTGARTGELRSVRVGDFLRRTRQVVLGKHKTSKTQRTQQTRHITLNDEVVEIFERFSTGKQKTDTVFTTSDSRQWTANGLYARFNRVKEIANEFGKVREHITIYDFRHLWISEALMAGNDVWTVARIAGTSVDMIERVYGHFRNDHLHEAQAKLDGYRANRRNGNA